MNKLLSSRARKLLSYTMTILLGLILSSAGCDKFDAMDPASYHGTWKWEHVGFDYWEQVTISANELVYSEKNGDGYTLINLTWRPITSIHDLCPTGFAITGTVTVMNGYAPPKADANDGLVRANVGETAIDWWYISKNGKSLMWGEWVPTAPKPTVGPFVKQ